MVGGCIETAFGEEAFGKEGSNLHVFRVVEHPFISPVVHRKEFDEEGIAEVSVVQQSCKTLLVVGEFEAHKNRVGVEFISVKCVELIGVVEGNLVPVCLCGDLLLKR